jgi:hypothetical protein
MRGKLFAEDFLAEGIRQTPAWKALDDGEVARFREEARAIFDAFPTRGNPNEAVTEHQLIFPVLEALGWGDILPQQAASVRGRHEVPDALLFPGPEARERAGEEASEAARYRHGVAILESKRWQRPLDRADGAEEGPGVPSTQMLRYLSRAETLSERAIQWGVLTNGRLWRLYFQGARSRSEELCELDLAAALGFPPPALRDAAPALAPVSPPATPEPAQDAPAEPSSHHALHVFLLLFGRQSFLPDPGDAQGRNFLVQARVESRLWEERVSRSLGEVVFQEVFPALAAALIAADPAAPRPVTGAYLEEARRATLTFLYRTLFLLYAEDRNLLPAQDRRYDDYSLRAIRRDVASRLDAADAFSATANRYYQHLLDLFLAVGQGDPSIGLPAYDGGLFEPGSEPLLERARLPDSALAPLLDRLSRRVDDDGRRRWINYRDLSVQHLGSIYERLLELDVVVEESGVDIRPNLFARRGSGSYYTHDDLVALILERTLGPRVEEARTRFVERADALRSARRPKEKRLAELSAADPAQAILALKVCDPAMGSGHFLVALVDFLADRALELMAEAEAAVDWAPAEAPYASPLAGRLEALRCRILETAEAERWVLDPDQLDDRHLVRRMVLKRCVHGVDKNPMAVELAKVALWLHTFTVGAPLSFLDHHLRVGDSLFGEWVAGAREELAGVGALYIQDAVTRLRNASQLMAEVSEIGDLDLEEVGRSKTFFHDADRTLQPLRRLLDLWHANRWHAAATGREHPGIGPLLRGIFGDLLEVAEAGSVTAATPSQEKEAAELGELLALSRRLAAEEHFLHWELAFPTVWPEMHRLGGAGGFDVVLGNPPWDRMKLQEVEWFAARRREIAAAPRAADRRRAIRRLEQEGHPLWEEYRKASDRAEAASAVARKSGHYPLLARGDVNIYSLFVERASRLVRPDGTVGLLVPSGIASDLGAAEFFRGLATSGRLAALLDFENRKVFFPDIHASFKFSALVFGGEERRFPAARCAFFLRSTAEVLEPETGEFELTPADFASVNPNTGTAPVFRRRRDAEITTAVYRRLPVLVDRRESPPASVWPVRYRTLFHMTNDSHHFKTAEELDAEGFYPVAGNRWRRGDEEYVPLYEGKMVQMYDHRAASIQVNPDNLHRPAQPVAATAEERGDPDWLPRPQYWVPAREVDRLAPGPWAVAFKDVTAPTNMRTMIAAVVPGYGMGNTLPILTAAVSEPSYTEWAPLLLANLSSFAFDYLARQKVQGQHLNLYIVEQIPVIPPARFEEAVAGRPLADFVRHEVLRLTYTARDLAPFARDLGYQGDPFPWDEQDRRHRMARLDALFFQLYGLTREEADDVLSQFPIVRADDEAAFGRYLTRDLVLAYMNAIAAGDLESRVAA